MVKNCRLVLALTGRAYWLDANAPGTQHLNINVGSEPIEVMVVELQNEK